MKIFSIYEQFKERNLSSSFRVEKLANALNIDAECDVILDLSSCLIDYPHTAKLLDKILKQLVENQCERKTFTIRYDFLPTEEILLNYLFIGSQFLGIEQGKAYKLEVLQAMLTNAFFQNNIIFIVEVIDAYGKVSNQIRFN